MKEYIKNDKIKFIAEDSKLIPILEADGWKLKEKKAEVKKTSKKKVKKD